MTLRCFLLGSSALLAAGVLLTGCASPSERTALAKTLQSNEELETRIRSVAHYAAGLSYDLNDKSDLALEEMIHAAEADLTCEPIVAEAARRCLRADKADLALNLLSKASSIPGASGTLFSWLGLAYAKTGKLDLAINANRTAIRKSPQSLTAYQNLAQVYLQTGRTNDAFSVLEEAAEQPVSDPGFLIDLADLYLAYGRNQSTQAAVIKKRVLQVLDRASDLGVANPLQSLRIADSYYSLGEFSKAEPFYRDLIEEHPDLPTLRNKLTDIYLRSGQKAKAFEQLETLVRNEPTNPQGYLLLGALAADEKKWAEAAEQFERALKLDPDLEQVYYDLAGIKLNLKKPEEAIALMEKARARFKLSFLMEFYTGIAYAAAEKYHEALISLTSAEAVAKATDPARLDHLFYFQMGSTQERAGNLEEAEKYFRETLKLSPDDPEALNYLGYMWAEHGIKLDEAHQLIDKAVQLQPDNAAFLDSLAWVLYKLNKPQEALAPMLKAIEKNDEPDMTLYDHLGDIYSSLQQHDKAREAWTKALEVKPNEQIRLKLNAAPPVGRSMP
ncbi:MAG: tetratricopeptide repeat protein [Verrucomicrobiota bacterium]